MTARALGPWLALGVLLACGEGEPSSSTPAPSAEPTEHAAEPEPTRPRDVDPPEPTGSPPVAVIPRSVRVVAVREHELMRPERRQLEQLERTLAARGLNPTLDAPSEAEAAAVRGWLAGAPFGARRSTTRARWLAGLVLRQAWTGFQP